MDFATEEKKITPREFQNGVSSFKKSFPRRSRSISNKRQKRQWNVIAEKNSDFERFGGLKLAFTLMAFLFAAGVTLSYNNIRYISCAWLIAVAVLLIADGLHFFDRELAVQSRVIAAVQAVSIIAVIVHPAVNTCAFVAFVLIAGRALISALNNKWMAAENWLMSDIGQMARRLDIDNVATSAYQAHGKRETRSVLVTQGYEPTEEALDTVFRVVWMLGYMLCYRHTEDARTREETVERQRETLERTRGELRKMTEENKELRSESMSNAEMIQGIRETAEQISDQLKALRAEYNRLKKERDDLLRTNDELMQHIRKEKTEKPAKTKKEEQLERLIEMINGGMSQNKAAAAIGISNATASRMMKNARAKGTIA